MVTKQKAAAAPARKPAPAVAAPRKAGPRAKAASAKPAARPAPAAAAKADRLVETAARNTLAVNPLIGIRAADFGAAAQALASSAVKQPIKAARHLGAFAKALGKAARGESELQVDPKDKRFLDPAWQSSAIHKRLLQAHTALAKAPR